MILTGFMGAGKSTVGALVAKSLGWRFVDLDQHIEAASNLSVADIFQDHGEAEFRERERQAILHLSTVERLVLALGGGAIESPSTRALLRETPGNCLIFLEAPLPELLARCGPAANLRPLLSAPESPEARLARRLPWYREAHLTVRTTDLAPHQVAEQVIEQVSRQWMSEGKR